MATPFYAKSHNQSPARVAGVISKMISKSEFKVIVGRTIFASSVALLLFGQSLPIYIKLLAGLAAILGLALTFHDLVLNDDKNKNDETTN